MSVEPCASAQSKRRRRAQPVRVRTRLAAARALSRRATPPWRPITVCGRPHCSSSSTVCESGRAVSSTSWPAASSRSTSGRRTITWAVLVKSTQTRIGALSSIPAPMRALVTGGAGFIGSNLVDALVARGDEVHVLDDLSTGRRENLADALAAGAVLHEADLRDGARVDEVVASAAPDVVFHLGAQIDVRVSVADPALDAAINVGGTINVLEAARRAGVARVVNSSTGGAIYGDSDRVPTPEDETPAPMSPYGQGKHAAEGYCELYRRLYGLSTVSLRYANVYGPRQDPHGEGGVVAIFCGKLLEGGVAARVRRRPADARLHLRGRRRGRQPGRGRLGSGGRVQRRHRGRDDACSGWPRRWRSSAAGAPFEPEHAPERTGEVHRSCVDPSLAREALGWEAQGGARRGARADARSAARLTNRIQNGARRGHHAPRRRIDPLRGLQWTPRSPSPIPIASRTRSSRSATTTPPRQRTGPLSRRLIAAGCSAGARGRGAAELDGPVPALADQAGRPARGHAGELEGRARRGGR